jgi:hypothetical protein
VSIQRRVYSNRHELTCDNCGNSEQGFLSFNEAADWAKENDWKARKNGDEWENWCPDCMEPIKDRPSAADDFK